MAPIKRDTARVLPVSPDGAVLLLQDQDPAAPGVYRWGSVGGAVDPGESAADAAVRELHEETGITATTADLVGPIGVDATVYTYDGVAYGGDSTFFALALGRDVEVTFDHLEPLEVGNVVASGWWTPDELADDGTAVNPSLVDLMRDAVEAIGAGA